MQMKPNGSAIERRAPSGETLEITDRGRLVAKIAPLEVGEGSQHLIGEGHVVPEDGGSSDWFRGRCLFLADRGVSLEVRPAERKPDEAAAPT